MLRIALGSANEATTHLRLASTLNGAPTLEFAREGAGHTDRVDLTKLIASIEREKRSPSAITDAPRSSPFNRSTA
jgi:hypothetical protein